MTRAPFGDPNGEQLVDGINSRFKTLFDAASLPLTNVAGTANDVTATLAPALDGDGLLDGMSFTITWTDENTGPMTLALNGGSPVPVLGADGGGLPPGSVGPNLRSLVSYVGGDFVLLSQSLLAGGAGAARYYWAFESSGTWEKPEGLPGNTLVTIAGWGGGGGGGSGSSGSGGGGGGYNEIRMRLDQLPESVTVIIGDGGAVGAHGGDSSFGSFFIAFGGQRGGSPGTGGNGAGSNQNGNSGGQVGGGIGGGSSSISEETNPWNGRPASTLWGGGGGARFRPSGVSGENSEPGGRAVFGGGGGASRGSGSASGGQSAFGGDGGIKSAAGNAPAGAGGGGAAGARGEIRIWI
ncbi:hypothetical protein [Roseinatronobacter sp.]|uniref:hypothetical protein n=1 Tax=Roseinatronobacter sp. TaxID=1945755 RepID=UPI003F727D27